MIASRSAYLLVVLVVSTLASVRPDTPQNTARENRERIENATAPLALTGQIPTDRRIAFKSGQSFTGPATIQNALSADYTVGTSGSGMGYIDWLKVTDTNQVTFDGSAENYLPGQPCFLFRAEGFFTPTGQLCTRRTVVSRADRTVRVDGPPLDPRLTAGKYVTLGTNLTPVSVGGVVSRFVVGFRAGDHVLLTDGPTVANQSRGEWHRWTGSRLEWPSQRSYANPVLARMQPVANVTLRNLTLGQPKIPIPGVTPKLNSIVFLGVNWLLDAVTVEGDLALTNCSDITLVDCKLGTLQINSCHRIHAINCTIGGLSFEECCFDCSVIGCTFGPSPDYCQPIGIAGDGSSGITIRDCRIVKAASIPIALTNPGGMVDGLEIAGASEIGYFSGNNLAVRNVRSAAPLCFINGKSMLAERITAPRVELGRTKGDSSGIAVDVSNVVKQIDGWSKSG